MPTSGSTSLAVKDTERRVHGRATGSLAVSPGNSSLPHHREQGGARSIERGLERQNTGIAAHEGSSLNPRLYLNTEFGI